MSIFIYKNPFFLAFRSFALLAASLCLRLNKANPRTARISISLDLSDFLFFSPTSENLLIPPLAARSCLLPLRGFFSHYNTFIFCASSAVRISPSFVFLQLFKISFNSRCFQTLFHAILLVGTPPPPTPL